MTQEEKQLLFKDLCARLPYGVICSVEHKEDGRWKTEDMKLSGIFDNDYFYFTDKMGSAYSDIFKPYLRPMSSMTEEEYEESCYVNEWTHLEDGSEVPCMAYIDWLNAHHFDYRGLILMGLAFEASEWMYKTE